MQFNFPAANPEPSSACVNLNLGAIGRLEANLGRPGPSVLKDFHGGRVETNPGLTWPGLHLEAVLLPVPKDMPVLLLAGVHHGMAFYALCDLQEEPAQTALKFATESGRLEIGFIPEGGDLLWSAMRLGPEVRQHLEEQLARLRARRACRDNSWRDRLALLLLDLPSLLSRVHPQGVQCTQHAAVLLSGNRAAHTGRELRNTPAL